MAKYWLVTWTTYGSWLPGDPRGFRTWHGREYVPPPGRYAKQGEKPYDPASYRDRLQQAAEVIGQPVTLSIQERRCVMKTLVAEIRQLAIAPTALAVADQHVHLIARFGKLAIRPTVGRLKAAATRRLRDLGLLNGRLWSRCCHMRSLANDLAYKSAVRYLVSHQQLGALLHLWTIPQGDDLSSA